MDAAVLARLTADSKALRLDSGPPPTYSQVTCLLEFLHLLEALRRYMMHLSNTWISQMGDELEPRALAELSALRAGAAGEVGIQTWVMVTFNWRRWALSRARFARAPEAKAGGKLASTLFGADTDLATGLDAEQLRILSVFERHFSGEFDARTTKRDSVQVGPLWELTKKWAAQVIFYAHAITDIKERMSFEGSPSPPPPAPQISIQPSPNSSAKKRKRAGSPANPPRGQETTPFRSSELQLVVPQSQFDRPRSAAASPRRSTRVRNTRSPSPLMDVVTAEEDFQQFVPSQSVLMDREETPAPTTAPHRSPQPSPARSTRSVRWEDQQTARAEREADFEDAAAGFDEIEKWIDGMPESTQPTPASAARTARLATPSHARQTNLDVPYESPRFVSSPENALVAGASSKSARPRQSKSPAALAPPLEPASSAKRQRTSPRQAAAKPPSPANVAGKKFHARMKIVPRYEIDSSPTSSAGSVRSRPSAARASMSPDQSFTRYASQLESQLLTQAPLHQSVLETQTQPSSQVLMSEEDEMAAAMSRSRRSSSRPQPPSTPGRQSTTARTFEQVITSASDSWQGDSDLNKILALVNPDDGL